MVERLRDDGRHDDIDRDMTDENVNPAGGRTKPPTPWPRGRRRNWRAAFMLIGAVVAMSVALSLWHAFS